MKVLPGQVAVVTGAASGIGLAFATHFAELGLKVVLVDINGDRLAQVTENLSRSGGDVVARRTDVSDLADLQGLCAEVYDRFGGVDILCNNAGIFTAFRQFWEYSHDEWQRVLAVNLWGVINGLRLFVPRMMAAGKGYIVNTSSMAGLVLVPSNAVYNAAKKAVISLSETLKADLEAAGSPLGVTVISPGWVESGLSLDPAMEGQIPEGMVLMKAADVAKQLVVAIERDQLYLVTHQDSDEMVADYQARVLDGVRQVP